jgi:UDP-perosamine 4-acetyltransferase
MDRLIILGARQHAKVLVSLIEELGAGDLEVVGYLDDDPVLHGTKLLGRPILGGMSDLVSIVRRERINAALVGVSNRFMGVRHRLYGEIKSAGLRLPVLVHPRAWVSRFAEVGEGTVLNPGVVVNAYARVGANCVVYSNSTIEHETRLADNVYIGPGVNFSSNARVGAHTFIGAGSRIIPDIQIGTDVVIGAGSVVLEDVPDHVTYAGIPARKINDRDLTRI